MFDRKNTQRPWYAEGLAFECSQCGRCCCGPEEGYVWVSEDEIVAIAQHLQIDIATVYSRYLRKEGGRFTIVEQAGRDCIFLSQTSPRRCTIYSVRPKQCRTWPFWQWNVMDAQAWNNAARRCPGINRGKLFTLAEIAERLENEE